MSQVMREEIRTEWQSVHLLIAETLGGYAKIIRSLDDETEWPEIIATAIQAGLGKDLLAQELSCAPSTLFRWQFGATKPARWARLGMKARLIELIDERRAEELRAAEQCSAVAA